MRSERILILRCLRRLDFVPELRIIPDIWQGLRPGQPPYTLIDYFPDDFIMMIDESHKTIPQIGGMYHGDQSRKQTLVDYGFRLPSANG